MKLPYLTDRKNKGARHGGDLAGLSGKLEYLDTLGITGRDILRFKLRIFQQFSFAHIGSCGRKIDIQQ
jgi:hypothetical protein